MRRIEGRAGESEEKERDNADKGGEDEREKGELRSIEVKGEKSNTSPENR
jgi:hypothetical protein